MFETLRPTFILSDTKKFLGHAYWEKWVIIKGNSLKDPSAKCMIDTMKKP
jgi:hypothetical protein